MQKKRETIIEVPSLDERLKKKENLVSIEAMRDLFGVLSEWEKKEELENVLGQLRPKVSLSWRKDVESVIKWMKEHMEPYWETHEGFLVDFIDDRWEKWYKVLPYYIHEGGEVEKTVKIKWTLYKIIKHTFSKEEREMYERIEKWMESCDKEWLLSKNKPLARRSDVTKSSEELLEELDKLLAQ